MKIAVLLLAHKQKEQLLRLISALKHDHIDIYIHLDAKCPFSPSDIQAPNVHFTEKRYDVGLFEFSMVEAEMELIRTARRHGEYRYFVLMSGQCYPIKPIQAIYDRLTQSYPTPFIEVITPTKENRNIRIFEHVYALKRFKLRSYHWLKRHFPEKVYRVLRYVPGGVTMLISRAKELIVKSPKNRLAKLNCGVFFGSQWWILPDTMVADLEDSFTNKAFRESIRDCFSCDETFFQTAVMAGKEKNLIQLDSRGDCRNRQWLMKFHEGHPVTLTMEQLEFIQSSPLLFARKFDMDEDHEILDYIDREILHRNL